MIAGKEKLEMDVAEVEIVIVIMSVGTEQVGVGTVLILEMKCGGVVAVEKGGAGTVEVRHGEEIHVERIDLADVLDGLMMTANQDSKGSTGQTAHLLIAIVTVILTVTAG